MSGNARLELAFVDVQVGAAHADLIDLDANLAGGRLGGRDVTNRERARRIVDNGLQGTLPACSLLADP